MGEHYEAKLSATIATTTMPTTRRKETRMGKSNSTIAYNTTKFQKSTTTSIHAPEVHMGQTAAASTNKPQGSFPSNTEKNPKEHANIITLRNGRQLE